MAKICTRYILDISFYGQRFRIKSFTDRYVIHNINVQYLNPKFSDAEFFPHPTNKE